MEKHNNRICLDLLQEKQLEEIAQILKEEGIWNRNVRLCLKRAKSAKQAKHIARELIEKGNILGKLEEIATRNKLGIDDIFLKARKEIISSDVKELKMVINSQIQFAKFQEKCVTRLSVIPLPKPILDSVKLASNQVDLDKALFPIPYQILRKCKLIKPAWDTGMAAKNSVRATSVYMKDQ